MLLAYGREVRRLREEAGFTQTALARHVASSKTAVSDVERGKAAASAQLRSDLDEILGAGRLTHLWKELTGSGKEVWKHEIAELIAGANAVYEYEVLVFPAYLQTEGYARTLIRYGVPWLPEDEIASRAEERAKRSQELVESGQPMVWLVLDETILMRRYGSTDVMREQLSHVLDLAERERITVQLVPASSPKHPGVSGAFKLVTTDHFPDVMFAENVHEGQMVTSTVDVAHYRMLFAALQGVASSPEEAQARLRDELQKLES
ncbi:helix-turn-helix domain-containing protein [Haloactinospora alba]|uniref:helix-turn-helix domain-containing protein n=1 Tax=Haloactinospora alba TaxID=405555 RepID=UPI001FECCACC|nr:helix-turn-helix transcriptional regulator [Haloactinospora alba]